MLIYLCVYLLFIYICLFFHVVFFERTIRLLTFSLILLESCMFRNLKPVTVCLFVVVVAFLFLFFT